MPETNVPTSPAHTPGPWFYDGILVCTACKNRNKICSVAISERPIAEVEANARLTAAAPELLEACKSALFALVTLRDKTKSADFDFSQLDVSILESAIAKAEGRA